MKITLKLVRVGMNMSEATVVEWHRQPGDRFVEGDVLYAFETEKVTQEVQATASGSLVEILVAAGEDVEVGSPVCIVDIARPA